MPKFSGQWWIVALGGIAPCVPEQAKRARPDCARRDGCIVGKSGGHKWASLSGGKTRGTGTVSALAFILGTHPEPNRVRQEIIFCLCPMLRLEFRGSRQIPSFDLSILLGNVGRAC